ncbi:outer membrane protein assembly factor BamE [Chitinibacter sp. S2-10]|uniref:outer membrane protein assembly factor BamE n=1 Tax=Chitinibacter sp. S2-10 TaxID=3373597 RepID=UPI003977732F
MKARILTVILSGSLLMTGCSVINFITPYKLDIPQGNAITADQIANLKPGMTQNQVRFVLGTPLLVDPFHQQRWEYIYLNSQGGKELEKKRFSVIFTDNMLTSWEGEVLPEPPARKKARSVGSAPADADELMSSKIDPGNVGSKEVEVKPLIEKGF